MKLVNITAVLSAVLIIFGLGFVEVAQGKRRIYRNHAICLNIYNTWWPNRIQRIDGGELSEKDRICAKFHGNETACNALTPRAADRTEYSLTDSEKETPCVMMGANSNICRGNPCNSYNNGNCKVDLTGGLCLWVYRPSSPNKPPNALTTKNTGLPYGCQRNPCNIGGMSMKKQRRECRKMSQANSKTPIVCAWCDGRAKEIKRSGMGCQLTFNTSADCEYIANVDNVGSSTIWAKAGNNKCQCSDSSLLCAIDVDRKDDSYKQLYP